MERFLYRRALNDEKQRLDKQYESIKDVDRAKAQQITLRIGEIIKELIRLKNRA